MHRLEKELYAKLQKHPEIFNFVAGSALDGFWYWDLENPEEEWMSPKLWQTLGYDPKTKKHEVSEWQNIINQDDLKLALENFEKHKADPSYPYDQVVRYTHATGKTIWIRCRGLIIRDDNNHPIRMIGAHIDITEIKESERRAIEALEAREQFFARMSHEIRTPLFGILGIAGTLKSAVNNEKIAQDISTILSCGEQLQSLLNDILTLAKLDAEKLSTSIEKVALDNVFSHIRELYDAAAKEKSLTLEIDTNNAQHVFVKTDKVRLTQVLSNLVSNAIKYTKSGSVTLSATLKAHTCTISVIDTGIGIKDVDTIFQAYKQEVSSYEGMVSGSGLGLEVVAQLCELLNYQLKFESQLGVGTQVNITMPADKLPPQHGPEPTQSELNMPTIERVLVVDDNALNLVITNKMLAAFCTTIEQASDGYEALQVINTSEQFDLILLDINMPKMNGYEVLALLNTMSLTNSTRIIMLSADAYEATQQKCLELGADGYLTKPFTQQDLMAALTATNPNT
ncbi:MULTISPECIES: hybrid sensor histidine kinase/response regulator [Pseudoalteromonas]|uniref:histidine kinase n=1 Tax=Pseudoalteromonas obscura TaxID=3048491 RepID=A0ABT7ET06_9GAMM|nr:PAS domain-containing hybrid sensor histidine kinase/response regulator [Pseudoalteromonas sp. P94(2023)]MBQ4839725.1 response regulator [Pseudoalteromonas luteoviolacea]MDK2598195.1 response regulator [Pseudoalteromonas sp. P94(2023)]